MELLPAFKEWSSAMAEILSMVSTLPDKVELKDVDFMFSATSGDNLYCHVIINGRREARITFEGVHTNLEAIREWFERILSPYYRGEICPEFIDIRSNGERARLMIAHSGFEDLLSRTGTKYHVPASLFAIHYRGDSKIRLWCFCETQQFVTRFYEAIMQSLDNYGDLLNDRSRWPSHSDFMSRENLSPVEKMRKEFSSKTVNKVIYCEKLIH